MTIPSASINLVLQLFAVKFETYLMVLVRQILLLAGGPRSVCLALLDLWLVARETSVPLLTHLSKCKINLLVSKLFPLCMGSQLASTIFLIFAVCLTVL